MLKNLTHGSVLERGFRDGDRVEKRARKDSVALIQMHQVS